MRANKYEYWFVIQQNYGQGWEDCSHYESNSIKEDKSPIEKIEEFINKYGKPATKKITLLKHDLGEYNKLGYSTRVIHRKELNQFIKNHINP